MAGTGRARYRTGTSVCLFVNERLRFSAPTFWLVDDALDLAHGVGPAADAQEWRGLGEVDRTDHAHHLAGDADRIAGAVGPGRGQLVLSVRPLRAVSALAVPGEGLVVAGGYGGEGLGEHGLTAAVADVDRHVGVRRDVQFPARRRIAQRGRVAGYHRG